MAQKSEALQTQKIEVLYGVNDAGQVIIHFQGQRIDNLTMDGPGAIEMAKQTLKAAHAQNPKNLVGFKEWFDKQFQVS